jgi:hypothetical protein
MERKSRSVSEYPVCASVFDNMEEPWKSTRMAKGRQSPPLCRFPVPNHVPLRDLQGSSVYLAPVYTVFVQGEGYFGATAQADAATLNPIPGARNRLLILPEGTCHHDGLPGSRVANSLNWFLHTAEREIIRLTEELAEP